MRTVPLTRTAMCVFALLGLRTVGAADGGCVDRGTPYSDGASTCQAGAQFRCVHGEWKSVGTPCADMPPPATAAPVARACDVDGTATASGTVVCRGGTNFRCSDGAWIALGTTCR